MAAVVAVERGKIFSTGLAIFGKRGYNFDMNDLDWFWVCAECFLAGLMFAAFLSRRKD